MTTIEPMTAAEYRSHLSCPPVTALGKRILAALEDREANLAHARLGSLVAAIREHKMFDCIAVFPRDKRDPLYGFPDANGLTNALAHLDSLLPKEPEVVVGESGREYRRPSGFVASVEVRHRNADGVATAWEIVSRVPVMDAPVVAKLMAGGGK